MSRSVSLVRTGLRRRKPALAFASRYWTDCGIAILMVLFPISRPNWRSAQVAVTRLLFFLVDVSQMGWLGRSGSPLAPHLLPQRHHAHRGYRDPGVNLAFTAVLAMLIRSDRGLLRLFRWRVPVWIGTISEGFYFSTFQA